MPNQQALGIQGIFLRWPAPANSGRVVQPKGASPLRRTIDAFPVQLRPQTGGTPLRNDVQKKMEQAMGANFSDVRIHVGPEASSIGAIAFTWGADIHFAPGQYNPHTPNGQFLLGHELAHVIQQRAGRVANPFGSGVAVVRDHALEAEADRMGRRAASIIGANAASPRGAPGVIHQKPGPAPNYAVRPAMPAGEGWEIQAAESGRTGAAGWVRLTPSENGMHISDLHVAPEHRRHGLATQLVQAAMHAARSRGFPVAQLEARPSPGAGLTPATIVSMYQKMGFRTVGRSVRGNPLMERRT